MTCARSTRCLRDALGVVLGVFAVLPAAALPPEENESWIELGTWITTDDSYKFGDYTGLDENGVHLLANFDISRRPVFDTDDVRWWRAQGQNLGSRLALGARRVRLPGPLRSLVRVRGDPEVPDRLGEHGLPGARNGLS